MGISRIFNMTLKSLISKIVTYWKLISAMIGIAGMLIVGKAKYDSWIIAKSEEKKIEISRWQKVDHLVKSDSTRQLQYDTLMVSVRNIYQISDKTSRKLNNLKDYMIEKAATKQDLLDVVKVFEIEKKNE